MSFHFVNQCVYKILSFGDHPDDVAKYLNDGCFMNYNSARHEFRTYTSEYSGPPYNSLYDEPNQCDPIQFSIMFPTVLMLKYEQYSNGQGDYSWYNYLVVAGDEKLIKCVGSDYMSRPLLTDEHFIIGQIHHYAWETNGVEENEDECTIHIEYDNEPILIPISSKVYDDIVKPNPLYWEGDDDNV